MIIPPPVVQTFGQGAWLGSGNAVISLKGKFIGI